MSARLTAVAIDKLKPGTSRREIADGVVSGLYVILQPSGAESWAIRCRIDGKPAKITLGGYPKLDLAGAREKARETLALIDAGVDPRRRQEEQLREEQERQAEQQREVANTVRVVAGDFLEKYLKRHRPRSWHDPWAALSRHVLPRWGDRPIDAIRRRDLHAIVDDLHAKPGAQHHVVAVVTKMFNWAQDREVIEATPFARLRRPKLGVRNRALSDAEIPIVWAVADAIGFPFGRLVQLALLTGCRRGEIAGLQWSEVDLNDDMITIPSSRYKTGLTLVVPLSAQARRLIDELPRFVNGSFVFSTTGGRRPISGFSKMMARFDAALARRCEEDGIAPFTFDLHDLRRTVRTGMSALRIAPHVAEAVLGHVVVGVQKHYDMWNYRSEKFEALGAWGDHVERIVTGGAGNNNVVRLRRS